MEEKKTMCAHRLSLDNRQEGTVTGVRDIHSFNESEILLETEAGRLSQESPKDDQGWSGGRKPDR